MLVMVSFPYDIRLHNVWLIKDKKYLPCYHMFSNTRIYDSLQVHSLVEQAYLHKSYERWVLKQGLIR